MYTTALIVIYVGVVHAVVTAAPQKSMDLCHGAPNCEVYVDERMGHDEIRFKAGMGPDSSWYKRSIALYDMIEQRKTALDEASDSDNLHHDTTYGLEEANGKCKNTSGHKNKVCTFLEQSKKRVNFGHFNSSQIALMAKEHCHAGSCRAEWSIETSSPNGPGSLIFNANGKYANKGYFFEALQKMIDGRAEHKRYEAPDGDGEITYKYYWQGSSYYNIQRLKSGLLAGYLSLQLTFERQSVDGDACRAVVKFLNAALAPGGEIASIGEGYFGAGGSGSCV